MKKIVRQVLSGTLVFIFMLNLIILPANAEEDYSIPEELLERIGKVESLPEILEDQLDEIQACGIESLCKAEEWQVLYLTNVKRMYDGLEPLSMTMNLQTAANVRANELPMYYGTDHKRPDGSEYKTVLNESGVDYQYAGENISRGYPDALEVWKGWMTSDEDRNNMADSEYSHIGVGYNGYSEGGPYWVQLFTGDCTPTSISILQGSESFYLMPPGRIIDEIGLVLQIECEHGTAYMPVIEEMCTGCDLSRLNERQTVTVYYGGLTTDFQIYTCEQLPFTDVPEDAWFYDYAAAVYHNGIMTGLTYDTFGPAEELSRAQFATILWRMSDEPEVAYAEIFPDVPDGQFYTMAAIWAYAVDVIGGYDDGRFGPSDQITREQMATMMYRYANAAKIDTSAKADLTAFPDCGSVSDFAYDAMSWAVAVGLITGDQGNINPQGNASRAVCATIITRFVDRVL